MRNVEPTEWLLARFAGRDRASAILGDLLEVSTTRGRVWFWTAYIHTLISLGWRAPVAFLCAYSCSNSYWLLTAIRASMHWLFHWVPLAGHVNHMPLEIRLDPLVSPLYGLHFLAPFVLVCFGLRDRLTRLALVLFLGILPTYSNRLAGLSVVEVFAAIAVLVALCLREWRRPLLVLALCLMPRYALVEALQYSYQPAHRAIFLHHPFSYLTLTLSSIVAAVLCLWLNRLLLRPRPAIA
jgi:hypothetical protein